MKKTFYLMAILLLMAACSPPSTKPDTEKEPVLDMELRAELMDILKLDQDLRISLDTLENMYDWESETVKKTWKQIHINDSLNLIRIEAIIAEKGWPGKSLVGEDMADVAFLVLQHCSDLEVMEKYLPVIKEAVDSDELDRPSLALYTDRISMFRGEPQLYGTQLSYDKETKSLGLYPVKDEDDLNARRKDMGLEPIEAYLNRFGITYKTPE